MLSAAEWDPIAVVIRRASWKWLGHVARMRVPALPKLALWGWPAMGKAGSRRRLQRSVLAKTSLSHRDWFRVAVSRGGQWQAVGRRFFVRKRIFKDQSVRLRRWTRGSPPPMPPPNRTRRHDSFPTTPSSPTICPVCREDLGSVSALGARYLSFHAVRDSRLVTRPSLQCSRCSLVFSSQGRLRSRACSSGDRLLKATSVGAVASSAQRPQPLHWIVATNGSATLSSPECPAAAGWGFLVQREGRVCWRRDPRALGP